MNYERKYKKALEIILEILSSGLDAIEIKPLKLRLQTVFPELNVSEDEITRNSLIRFLESPFVLENVANEKVEYWITWLEKQGETNTFDTPKTPIKDSEEVMSRMQYISDDMENNIILEDYCSYEVSKLLNEKGFPINEHLYMYINKDGKLMTDHQACLTLTNEEYRTFFDDYIPTITHQMARRWLRKKGIDIFVDAIRDKSLGKRYEANVYKDMVYQVGSHTVRDTYEKAVDVELKYCLAVIL